MKNNTINYVFQQKQPELRRLVVKYGLPPAKDSKDLWTKTNYLVAKFKDEMLKDIASIHPDKELILWAEKSKTSSFDSNEAEIQSNIESNIENYSNGCGCSAANGEPEYSNYSGKNCTCKECSCNKNQNQNQKMSNFGGGSTLQDNLPFIVIGSLLLVGGLVIFGNK